jgi:hypothetical protein
MRPIDYFAFLIWAPFVVFYLFAQFRRFRKLKKERDDWLKGDIRNKNKD